MENSRQLKIAVVGFGNILMADDGVGVHVIYALQDPSIARRLPPTVEFIDGGTNALDVIMSLDDVDKLVIVDAVKTGGSPGEIHRFDNFTAVSLQNTRIENLSLHDVNLIDALKIAGKINRLPEKIILMGIEPKEIKLSMELSEEVKNKMHGIIKIVLSEVSDACFTAKTN